MRGVCLSPYSFSSSSFCLQPFRGFQNPQGWFFTRHRKEGNDLTQREFRWLLSHGHDDKAVEVLACIEAMDIDDPYIRTQYDEIKYSIAYERDNAVRWRDLVRRNKTDSTKTLRRLVLGASTQAIQQFQGLFYNGIPIFNAIRSHRNLVTNRQYLQGINIMSYYLPTVLMNSVGLSNTMARLLTACNATSYFIFSCVAVTMIERFGRRGLMLLSGSGQFLSFLVITILLRFATTDRIYGTASVAFFFLYHVAFGMGMLGVPWLYPTEINSLPMRTKGAAVATATNWYAIFPPRQPPSSTFSPTE